MLGGALCRVLVADGDEVVAMWHLNEQRLKALSGLADLTGVQGDIRNPTLVTDLCGGVDAVCHLAVLPPGAPGAAETNIQGTQNVVDGCCRTDVEHLVYASSMSVYDFLSPQYLPVDEAHPCQPLQDYGREKLQGEALCMQACRTGELRVCALRLAGIFGPGKPHGAAYVFARAIMADEPVVIETDRAIDLLYVEDAARALQLAIGAAETGVFNIGSGDSCALSRLAEKIGQRLGQKPRIQCRAEGNPFFFDISRARSILGYEPMPLDAALDHFVPWVQKYVAN